jgi:hypothetical protein
MVQMDSGRKNTGKWREVRCEVEGNTNTFKGFEGEIGVLSSGPQGGKHENVDGSGICGRVLLW